MTRTTIMISLLCLPLVIGAAIQGGPRTRGIAVINVPKTSDAYKKVGPLEEGLKAKRAAFQQQLVAKQEEIQKLQKALDTQFVQGTPDYATRREELILKSGLYQDFLATSGKELDTMRAEALRTIFEDIKGVAGRVAQARGIDVVLTIDELPEGPASPDMMKQVIMLQKVIYATPNLDLTAEVIKVLNDEYDKSLSGK